MESGDVVWHGDGALLWESEVWGRMYLHWIESSPGEHIRSSTHRICIPGNVRIALRKIQNGGILL